MKRKNTKSVESINELFALMDDFGADIDMTNKITGETIKPDSAAMLAGIQSGLAVSAAIFESKQPVSRAALQGLMMESIRHASHLFMRRKEAQWDSWAADCAGREDGE